MLLPQRVYGFHVGYFNHEIIDVEVLHNPLLASGFGQDDEIMLQGPSQANLSFSLLVIFG